MVPVALQVCRFLTLFKDGSFITLSGPDQDNALKCGANETINYTISVGKTSSNVTVKCVLKNTNGTRLESNNKTIGVLKSYGIHLTSSIKM
jgi:hypothetical protein